MIVKGPLTSIYTKDSGPCTNPSLNTVKYAHIFLFELSNIIHAIDILHIYSSNPQCYSEVIESVEHWPSDIGNLIPNNHPLYCMSRTFLSPKLMRQDFMCFRKFEKSMPPFINWNKIWFNIRIFTFLGHNYLLLQPTTKSMARQM